MSRIAEKMAWYVWYIKCKESKECAKKMVEKLRNDPKTQWDIFTHAVALVWAENFKKYGVRLPRKRVIRRRGEKE